MNETFVPRGMNRRDFLVRAGGVCVSLGLGALTNGCAQSSPPPVVAFSPLPFRDDALEPHISRQTIGFHYGKHHKAYVDKTIELVKGTKLAGLSFQEIMKQAAGSPEKTDLFNNAAQSWNHEFFWNSVQKGGGGKPEGEIRTLLDKSFGSYENFRKEFLNAALTQFGSGWAWLVIEGDSLKVVKTANADNPTLKGQTPLLTIDVWEHAYYLDYQNRRGDYVNAVFDHLLNWKFAAENLTRKVKV